VAKLFEEVAMPQSPTPYLHIYSPQDAVRIIGTRAGLRALLAATFDALLYHRPRHRLTYRINGMGAELHVEMVTKPRLQSLAHKEMHG
jgi:hypothetical protein